MRHQRLTARRVRLRPVGGVLPFEHLAHVSGLTVTVGPVEWRPRADISETDEELRVVLDLAGVDEDEVSIELFEDALVVTGDRRIDGPPGEARYHLSEIRRGPFRIEVLLPARIEADGVTAGYDRGLLSISLPRAEAGS